mgnify:CR=1 FL=1
MKKPNIIVILADDLGYGDVSCYNSEAKVQTKNIDRLANEGLKFNDAHAPATVCTPSRYSVLTGRMAFRTGMRGVFCGAGGPNMIEEDRLSLPSMLKQKGYTTACFGKWHVGLTFQDKDGQPIHDSNFDAIERIDFNRNIPDSPIHRGFDYFYGTACCSGTDHLYAYIDGDRVPVPPTGMLDKRHLPTHAYSLDNRDGHAAPNFDIEEIDQLFLEKSVSFIEDHVKNKPDEPFFLYHPTNSVHLPSFASRKFHGKTEAGPHGDFIYEFDQIVGGIMDVLDRMGISDDTLLMVTSDNGPEIDSIVHMRKDYGHDGARPWRGVKRDNWEGGHRIPFITRWPKEISPQRTTDQTTCLCDIMSTCAAIAEVDLPEDSAEDSFSLLPVFLGEQNENDPIREYTLHQTNSLNLSIRKGEWKYLAHQGSGGNNYDQDDLRPFILPEKDPGAPGQLYNLSEDPGETTNLYSKFPKIVDELKETLAISCQKGRSR